jgi:signal transduction histidine kinase
MLSDFLAVHREELLERARLRVAARNAPLVTELELTFGLPVFFDQLRDALRRAAANESIDHTDLARTASHHGHDLFHQGLTVAQVVHDYGDLCQVIALLAMELNIPIAADEFRTLDLCLDDAIAGAVTEFSRQRERAINGLGTERLGFLAHELRNQLNNALLSFASIKSGMVAPGGSTGALHDRSLLGMQRLIDRSLADVRLDAGLELLERVAVHEIIDEVEISATLFAAARDVFFSTRPPDRTVVVLADRQILVAAIANLLQNAFKFTRSSGRVSLNVRTTPDRVLIDVADECGGLPPGKHDVLLQPFTQRSLDRSGLGLGLTICVKAVQSMAGQLHVRDYPGTGCVFTIDLPKQPALLVPAETVEA